MHQQIIIDHKTKGKVTSYNLKPDVLQGFRDAVSNNQVSLAMEYLRHIVDELLVRVSPPSDSDGELVARVVDLENTVRELKASLAPARKVMKKVGDTDVE